LLGVLTPNACFSRRRVSFVSQRDCRTADALSNPPVLSQLLASAVEPSNAG